MTQERWQQVDKLLDGALERPTSERPAFLEKACDDPALRREVESLLTFEGKPNLLDRPVFGGVSEDENLGRRIGPYRLRRLLGRGGMGAVYLAVREDDFEGQVALKEIRRGMDTAEVIRRFKNERQILAGLDHPNIARIFDGGTTDDGLPYFVMEYVEGEPIDRYCDHHELDVHHRLELFRQVCSAVHLSHQHLVVHRDLKPGNILVTAEGVPKLLDFGIAKILDSEFIAGSGETALDYRPMTPDYASPEQVRGEAVHTTSDVYSLGVLLYELLTGFSPYARKTGEELRQLICDREPPRPSSAVRRDREGDGDARRAWRRLSGDLDSIVLKALRKEARYRYSSVEQLSQDIRCYLYGLPVLAREGTVIYRAGKFLRRNRWPLATAAAFLMLSLSFGTIATVRQQAVREQQRAERVLEFLEEILRLSDVRTTRTPREVLDMGREKISESLENEPELQARLMLVMAGIYSGLGSYDQARSLLKESLSIRRQVLGNDHWMVAEAKNDLALLLHRLGDDQEAERLLEEAVETFRQHYPEGHLDLAKVLSNMAVLWKAGRDYDTAKRLYDEALEIKVRLYGRNHLEVAATRNNLASLFYTEGAHGKAERMYRETLAIRRELLDRPHPDLARSYQNLAVSLLARGEYGEAETLLNEALSQRREVLDKDHPDIATTLNSLAFCLHRRGRLSEATRLYREALAIRREKLPEGSTRIANTRRHLASVLADRGEKPLALEGELLARQALETFRNSKPAGDWEIAYAESVLGGCLAVLGRYQEAEALLDESYPAILEAKGEHSPYTLDARRRIDELYEARDRAAGQAGPARRAQGGMP